MYKTITTLTTELEAVNIMLSGIGESPVNSLSGEVTTDVSLARSILSEVSREVQLEGWTWNTEHDYPLHTDDSGEVRLPKNSLRVFFRNPDTRVFVIRGDKLYDMKRHTFDFTDEARDGVVRDCSLTLMLSFEEMPETARRYVTLKALRIFQERTVGAQVLSQFQRDDESKCRAMLLGDERKAGRHNMLQGITAPNGMGWQVFQTMQRVI